MRGQSTTGELELEAYLRGRGLQFERHPKIDGVTSAKRVDFLVRHPAAAFLCEVKDINSWQISEKLLETPDEAQWISPQLDLGRARSRILHATDKQLNPYAGTYPLVAALTQAAASDADLSRFSMLELLIGQNTLKVSLENRGGVEQLVPNDYHGLFFLERGPDERDCQAVAGQGERGTGWRYRVGALSAVVVIDNGGEGLEAYLNPLCESLPLEASVFNGPNDRVFGPLDGCSVYSLMR